MSDPNNIAPSLTDRSSATAAVAASLKVVMESDLPAPGTPSRPTHTLGLFLDTADRVCASVSFIVLCASDQPVIHHAAGKELGRDIRARLKQVSKLDTTPAGVDATTWKSMTRELAEALEEGLRLTGEEPCDQWRLRYRALVTRVRHVHGRLAVGAPLYPSPDALGWRLKERTRFPSFTVRIDLTPAHWQLLAKLQALGATSKATRRTLSSLAKMLDEDDGLPSGTRTEDNLKKLSQKLRHLGYTTANQGRGAGIWLTESGQQLAAPATG